MNVTILEFTGIDKKMKRTEESNRYMHGQLLELSDRIHNVVRILQLRSYREPWIENKWGKLTKIRGMN